MSGQLRFTNTITIDRPAAAVFAYLADLENLPTWNYAIQQTRRTTPGPVTVGTRYRQIRTVPTCGEESLEVIEYEPGRRLTVRGSLNTLPARLSYELRPDGPEAGATVLTNTVELHPPRALHLVAPVATRRIKSAVAANLEVLRQHLERG